jgi:hypothetical protein
MDRDEAILRRLDRIADGVDKLVGAIPQPKPMIWRIIDATAAIMGAAGIIAIADIVIRWFIELVNAGG